MPWPWRLAELCYDHVASYYAGTAVFKWPFPLKSALENAYYLDMMQHVTQAYRIFSKDPETFGSWTPAEQRQYRAYLEVLADA